MKKQRVLIIRLSALGDVAMTVPAVVEAAKAAPEAEFTVLTRPFFARLYSGPDMPSNITTLAWNPSTESLRSIWAKLRSRRFTHVADMHNVPRSWLLTLLLKLTGARTAMLNKHRLGRRSALRHKTELEPFTERYRRLLTRLLGLPAPTPVEPLPLKAPHSGAPRIGIAPFARYSTKAWPMENVRRLVKLLADRGFEISLFGSRGEEQAALEALASQHPENVTSEAGKHSLQDEIALMGRMDVMVAMDSANHHLASLAASPCLSIWGSTTPACGFRAWRQSPEWAMSAGLPCQPCSVAGVAVCPKGACECMQAITPEAVEQKILSMLPRE